MKRTGFLLWAAVVVLLSSSVWATSGGGGVGNCDPPSQCPGAVDSWLVGGPFTLSASMRPDKNNRVPVFCEQLSEAEAKQKAKQVFFDRWEAMYNDSDYHHLVTAWFDEDDCECKTSDASYNESRSGDLLNLELVSPDCVEIIEWPDWHIPGEGTITIKVEDFVLGSSTSCDPSIGLSPVADESAEYSVTVVVEDFEPCGPCIPDSCSWTCDEYHRKEGWTYLGKGRNYLTGDPPKFYFYSSHLFDFTRQGASQGVGVYLYEKIDLSGYLWVSVDGVVIYTENWSEEDHIEGKTVGCASTCEGTSRVAGQDIWAIDGEVEGLPISNVMEYYTNENMTGDIEFEWELRLFWLDQRIFSTGDNEICGPYGTFLKCSHKVLVTDGSPPTCAVSDITMIGGV